MGRGRGERQASQQRPQQQHRRHVDRRPPAALRGGGRVEQQQAARAARLAERPAAQLRRVAQRLSQRQWREDLACRMATERDVAERRRLFYELYLLRTTLM